MMDMWFHGFPKPSPEFPKPSPEFPKPSPEFPKPSPEIPKPSPKFPKPSPEKPKPSPKFPKPSPKFPKPSPEILLHPRSYPEIYFGDGPRFRGRWAEILVVGLFFGDDPRTYTYHLLHREVFNQALTSVRT
ncbi:hypothetical protein BJ508DRAFT_333741 [Ascobolus immersus RN42]|uniref:Uncharacterized protein n=1 Tax=Ascobolus immersus RN42 TaxID=1160509 RepID=A0A3N4HLK4_ASCIM|nr:hypothetical protein BJ508DRAFT_333741 [Ascobolus immersus RN42]